MLVQKVTKNTHRGGAPMDPLWGLPEPCDMKRHNDHIPSEIRWLSSRPLPLCGVKREMVPN